MKIIYSTTALKFLSKLERQKSKKIIEKINQYAQKPENLQNQVKKLQGCDYYRLRVDNYRVIFDKMGNILSIIEIGHSKDIYK